MSGAPPIGPAPGIVNLAVVNASATLDDAAFEAAVAAVGVQVSRDFVPAWGVGAVLTASRLDLAGAADIDGATQAVLYVGDQARDPTLGVGGVYGYHATNHGALPYAFVYLDVCALHGEPWTCTLSHEVLELLADPAMTFAVRGPAPAGEAGEVLYGLEVCDPTQRDHYEIDGVPVANFVTRAYFGQGAAGAATNHLGLDLAPFGARPGGYVQYDDGAAIQLFEGSVIDPIARQEARARMGEHRRNARREASRPAPDAGQASAPRRRRRRRNARR